MQRWNLPGGWVISARPAHPALVSEAGFIAAQDITPPVPLPNWAPGNRDTCWPGCWPAGPAGGGWNHLVQRQCRLPVPPRPHQRRNAGPGRPKNAYIREDRILPHLPALHLLLTGTDQRRAGGGAPAAEPTPRRQSARQK